MESKPTMDRADIRKSWSVALVSLVAGAVSWFLVVTIVGERDPMRHGEYFMVGYPLLIVVAAALGWKNGPSAWYSGFFMLGIQLLIGFASIPGDLNLLPVGLLVFLVLALGCSVATLVAGFLARRFAGRN
jgi:hypothetical protein